MKSPEPRTFCLFSGIYHQPSVIESIESGTWIQTQHFVQTNGFQLKVSLVPDTFPY